MWIKQKNALAGIAHFWSHWWWIRVNWWLCIKHGNDRYCNQNHSINAGRKKGRNRKRVIKKGLHGSRTGTAERANEPSFPVQFIKQPFWCNPRRSCSCTKICKRAFQCIQVCPCSFQRQPGYSRGWINYAAFIFTTDQYAAWRGFPFRY